MHGNLEHGKSSEFYGFAIYLISFVVFGMLLLWAYIPDSVFIDIGITYIPNKMWAIRFPCFMLLLIMYLVVMNYSYGVYKTPPWTSFNLVTDEHASVPDGSIRDIERLMFSDGHGSIPDSHDLPIWYVNRLQLINKLK